MIQAKTYRSAKSTKVLAVGLLLAALLTASTMLAASKPVQAATTFTVLNTNDSGSGSLRRTIDLANLTSGADTIKFAIPGDGVKTIALASELPAVTGQVTIDGYTQPGSSPNTLTNGTNAVLKVQLDGSNAGQFADGLDIGPGANNSVVKGLVINSFDDDGIDIQRGVTGARIEGNFIGTDPTGTVDRGNGDSGVFEDDAKNNTIGGGAPAARNLISGNDDDGVVIFSVANETRVEGNLIGTKKNGTSALGNAGDGVNIIGASNNTVGGAAPGTANTIAFNGGDGINVESLGTLNPSGNRILGNSVFQNSKLGIDLKGGTENATGATANDPGDVDSGPNNLQNKPVLTGATTSTSTFVRGSLNSVPNTVFQIQFFSNSSGNEGKKVVGIDSLTTDANGNATFNSPVKKVALGQGITATAIHFVGGNTSEFSAPVTVVAQ